MLSESESESESEPESSSVSSSKLLSASEYSGGRVNVTGGTGGSFGRLLLESDVLRVGREVLEVGIPDGSAGTDSESDALFGKYDSAILVDASIDKYCKLISFYVFGHPKQAEGKLTCPVSTASRA